MHGNRTIVMLNRMHAAVVSPYAVVRKHLGLGLEVGTCIFSFR